MIPHHSRAFVVAAGAALLTACAGPTDEPTRTEAPAEEPAVETMAQPDTLIPRELIFGNPERTQGRISPDGRHVSWLAPVEGVLNVWVAPADDPSAAKPITRDRGRGIRSHFWVPDSSRMLYIQDTGGDEDFHLYAVPVEGGEPRDLTPFEQTHAIVVKISREHPDRILVGLNNRDPRWHDVHSLNLESGELTLVERNEGMSGYIADYDLDLRLAARSLPDGSSELLQRGDDEEWVPMFTVPPEDVLTTAPIATTPDGDGVYMVDSRGRDTAALVRLDLSSGESTVLGASDRADVSELLIDAASREAVAYGYEYLMTEWEALDPAVGEDLERLRDALDADFDVTSQTADGQRWVVYSERADEPGRYHLYDRETDTLTPMFVTRPALEDQPLTAMHPEEIPTRDGLTMVSYLSLPRWTDPERNGRPAVPQPMVLLVHGGPWARDSYGYNAWHQWLANRGYAVLSVNFRGSTGFGKEFLNAGNMEWAGKMHDDLIDAVAWAVDEGITQSDTVAIMGGSYGGYATLVGLTFTPETFACGVDIVGPSNLETLLASIPPYWESFFEQFARRVGDPRTDEGRRLLRDRSPLYLAENIERPLLIGQGANDPRVKQPESDQIVAAMKEHELPVTYVLYPDEGHGFARPENSMAFNAITEAFLAQCIAGRHQPIGDALEGSSTRILEGAEFVPGLADALEGFEPKIAK